MVKNIIKPRNSINRNLVLLMSRGEMNFRRKPAIVDLFSPWKQFPSCKNIHHEDNVSLFWAQKCICCKRKLCCIWAIMNTKLKENITRRSLKCQKYIYTSGSITTAPKLLIKKRKVCKCKTCTDSCQNLSAKQIIKNYLKLGEY